MRGRLVANTQKVKMAQPLFYFLLIVANFIVILLAWSLSPTPQTNHSMGFMEYESGYIIAIIAVLLGMLYILRTTYWHTFSVYENGITLPYPALSNFLFFKNKKEGAFLPYKYIVGYLGVEDIEGEDVHQMWLKKGRDAVTIFYWDDKKKRIRMEMFTADKTVISELRNMLNKWNIKKAPLTCPNCGKKLYGLDYLHGECLKCHYKLFEIPSDKEEKVK